MYTLAIVGCGYLAEIITNGLLNGLLPEYKLVGAMSRTAAKANRIAEKINRANQGYSCVAYTSIDELLATKPDYIIETASPSGLKEFAIAALKNGSSIVTLSIGAFADKAFYTEAAQAAKANNARIYIASGAIGGFDVLRTATLMGNASVTFDTEKSPRPLRFTKLYSPELQDTKKQVFSGTATEAIAMLPTQVNVSVAASIASVGPDNVGVTITSTPGYIGDRHVIQIKNDQVDAVVNVYSSTPEIAGWSVIETLQNIVSPIVF
ncbi:aspartate dehydrogenase domain-containing protein [Bacteroides sp.]|uniref:aspartate dehydrogenase domain-containing protein n=1 Tax=Bacteroides sp. TaxID=29523 RepID=UPI001B5A9876|nr:aspartate dehydrogenase domain-containing protein [Bacteroides sp.]MBP6064783.1 DUF108 domain-containing protein [Bacteroides sp.]MBP6067035.1 DUF108 domain-containing protein [Bacteroides sp.]MBP6935941.1 DUF108 domain-containing protein [Bacteroides sp.]MBP8621292.1 DUF108 domain-containing protein [Bacteroides sp.]MBP9586001.1 DUF108 domain-containing protein [Bacteroides sp.]